MPESGLSKIKSLILDMDGVIWKSDSPIGNLPSIFHSIRSLGLNFAFATNNSTQTPDQYVSRLASFGVIVEPWQVVTSSLGIANLVAKDFPVGTRIYAIGGSGVMSALQENGFELLPVNNAQAAQAVVMGLDTQINFEKICEATLLVGRGVPFYATNPDKTFPTPRGEIPGAGAWISVVVTATGIEPVYAGKPEPFLLELARERLGTAKEETLVVGDRLETDIAGGQSAQLPTALVLTGISTIEQAKVWPKKINWIFDDLSSLVVKLDSIRK